VGLGIGRVNIDETRVLTIEPDGYTTWNYFRNYEQLERFDHAKRKEHCRYHTIRHKAFSKIGGMQPKQKKNQQNAILNLTHTGLNRRRTRFKVGKFCAESISRDGEFGAESC
jgi:hypothetical protein